ncbi:MAG TPA: carbohydrate ABC transporter permease [Acetobacteraceae bacterium]|jgi:ABC-type glycerol-3-phosphate transport system permease component|nr:carbohydrate ABC transporter permease [Acetobacteraceae bacterium]
MTALRLRHPGAHVLLVLVSTLMLLPLLFMLVTAAKVQQDLFTKPLWFIPAHPQLAENIERVFQRIPFGTFFGNSLFVSIVVTASDLFFSTLAGYALAVYRFPGRQAIFAVVIGTMMVPFIVILIPQYIIVRDLGWLDTYQGLIAPFAVSSFGIFLMRQAFRRMPIDLIDAARIDGAGEWRILFRIVVPLNVAPLVSLAILRFLDEWDNLLWPLVVTSSEKMRTLALGMALLQDDRYGTDFPMLMAAAALAIAPIVIAYVFLQRYFIRSVAGTGLKE